LNTSGSEYVRFKVRLNLHHNPFFLAVDIDEYFAFWGTGVGEVAMPTIIKVACVMVALSALALITEATLFSVLAG
jgi:hypothetical protein